ncbi:MAG: DUF983 domain-containing protein [Alphaproteobacteria bacterium]
MGHQMGAEHKQDAEPKLHHWGGPQIGAPEHETSVPDGVERPTWLAIKRGAMRKCPRCGTHGIMTGYNNIADKCSHCGLETGSFRTDDGPAYLTLVIGGHIIAPLFVLMDFTWDWPEWGLISFWLGLTLLLMGGLLPVTKGAFLGWLWASGVKG